MDEALRLVVLLSLVGGTALATGCGRCPPGQRPVYNRSEYNAVTGGAEFDGPDRQSDQGAEYQYQCVPDHPPPE